MNGGVITGNTAPMGGGVSNWGSFTMNGGTITGNTATEGNGGSGVAAYSSITLSGAARIDGNVGSDVALFYVELDGTVYADSKIVVGGTLTGAAQHPINVCYKLGDIVPDPMVFTEGLSGKGSAACFNSVDTNYRLCRLNSAGEAELSNSLEILTVDEGGYPVYDAWVMVLDQDESIGVLEQWPSGENAHSYSGFTVGVPYTLQAQAPAGYEAPADIPFSIDSNGKLIVNGSPVDNGKLVMTMSIARYNLTVPENIEGGTVTVTVNGEPASTARMDDTVCVTYTPAANYRLFSSGAVRADGTGIYVDWSDDYLGFTFRMPAQSVTLPTEFRRTLTGVDFVLPDFIQIIEDNAFEGAKMSAVYVPDGCEAIGAEAFKNCTSLTQIRLPRFCDIDSSAFTGCGTLYVFAPAGGTTESWCQNRAGIVFIAE